MKTMTADKALTESVVAPKPTGRTKTVWRDTQECAHRWASGSHHEGRAGNVFFYDGTVFSYGNHFPIATWQNTKRKGAKPFVLLTTKGYSSSTARHIGEVRHAIPEHVDVFRVDNPRARTRQGHLDNLKARQADALSACRKAQTARTRKAEYQAEAANIIKEANAYAERVGLKQRLKSPVGTTGLQEWAAKVFKAETEAENKRKIQEAKRAALAVAEWEQKLNAWKDGAKQEPGRCPDSAHPLAPFSFLRVKGTVLETSQRVAVPLKAALPVLALVRSGRGYNYHERPSESAVFNIDGFDLREVDQESKTVTIGCHLITFNEIERAAKVNSL